MDWRDAAFCCVFSLWMRGNRHGFQTGEAFDLSKQELADSIGASRETGNAIKKDGYNPAIQLCRNICRGLGKTPGERFGEESCEKNE